MSSVHDLLEDYGGVIHMCMYIFTKDSFSINYTYWFLILNDDFQIFRALINCCTYILVFDYISIYF